MSLLLRRRAMMLQQPRLPWTYQEVEYLQSSGTQYIDTGVIGNRDTALYYEGARTEVQANASWVGGEFLRAVAPVASSGTYARFLGKYFQSTDIPVKGYLEKNTVFLDKDNYVLNGVEYPLIGTFDKTTDTSSIRTNAIYNSYMRIWVLKIYNNSELVRDLIPCYRKSDNVAGMYDLVSNTFFTNAGTGDFIVGPDVN